MNRQELKNKLILLFGESELYEMLEEAGKEHANNGGTGITNFYPEELEKYNKAIVQSGMQTKLWIVKAPYRLEQLGQNMYSLHTHTDEDLEPFWKVFDSL